MVRSNLITDYGRDSLKLIDSYDGFVNEPLHINYKDCVGNYYNKYFKISHIPSTGEWANIDSFLRHIFQEQYEIGLDYFQLLFTQPKQRLPILCLVSEERNTGKSTFQDFVKAIFQNNSCFASVQSLLGRFNSDWVSKLTIGLDEFESSDMKVVERLKFLSTTKKAPLEEKSKERVEIPFYGKFIICSNFVHTFIKIPLNENRFWVREINPVPMGKDDTSLLSKMEEEIPAFLHFLSHRLLKTKSSSRMWFSNQEIETQALLNVKKYSKSKLALNFQFLAQEIFDQFSTNSFSFTLKDLRNLLCPRDNNVSQKQLKDECIGPYKIESVKPSNYKKIRYDSEKEIYYQENAKGRFFTFTKEMLDL